LLIDPKDDNSYMTAVEKANLISMLQETYFCPPRDGSQGEGMENIRISMKQTKSAVTSEIYQDGASGATFTLWGRVVDEAGAKSLGLNNVLPLGCCYGVSLYLDGSKNMNPARTDACLGWIMPVAKSPQGDDSTGGTLESSEPALLDTIKTPELVPATSPPAKVAKTPKTAKGKAAAASGIKLKHPTPRKSPKPQPPPPRHTHVVMFKQVNVEMNLSRKLHFECDIPYLSGALLFVARSSAAKQGVLVVARVCHAPVLPAC